ncbi:hypothetical protein C8Q77DRAFT_503910 [Trametes polyzona]|nr:hypothetical protein C8Q77DRAFT_503910 [Trametes polyzona]
MSTASTPSEASTSTSHQHKVPRRDRGEHKRDAEPERGTKAPWYGIKNGSWTKDQLAVVSILIKEKKQLREAVRRYEAAEERMEKYRIGPLARQRLDRLQRKMKDNAMQPRHLQELREILEDFPEDEAAPLKQKLREYETRRLLQMGRTLRGA